MGLRLKQKRKKHKSTKRRQVAAPFFMKLTLLSPAKVNLFLRVVARRPDGYHELASLFQVISLMDKLHFALDFKDSLSCTDPTLPTDSSNLVMKAANLFRSKTGLNFGVNIHLEKNIPHQSGLGGGSSNAATTLWALNQLCGKPASLEVLMAWSSEIGSDVTFFLSEGTAYCTGRGEIVRSMPALPDTKMWVVKPDFGLSTPMIYQNLKVEQLQKRDPKVCLHHFYQESPVFFNDLELPAFAVMPQLINLKHSLLSAGFHTVLMTGSGSAFFCIGKDTPPQIPNTQVFSAQFINRQRDAWYQ
jgi:4-diphosphocytidyl-2-C-methyl-D-erythritol kinase